MQSKGQSKCSKITFSGEEPSHLVQFDVLRLSRIVHARSACLDSPETNWPGKMEEGLHLHPSDAHLVLLNRDGNSSSAPAGAGAGRRMGK
jgi:hypothetical protein